MIGDLVMADMHSGAQPGVWMALNSASNILIVLGYLLVPFTVLRYLPLSTNVRLAGTFFFSTCALTHLAMAFNVQHHRLMVVNHVIQAIAVLWFVIGFWLLLREATRRKAGE